jgi:hypothetical protein
MSKAKFSFWLDGGYDFELVMGCPKHPTHDWWTFRVGDVLKHPYNPDELMTICRSCYVPRCGSTVDEANRCLMWRHHKSEHTYPNGAREPVGGIKAW